MSAPVVAAIDVGGTSLKGALVDASGRMRVADPHPLAGATGPAAFAALEGYAAQLAASARRHGLALVGAGVIAPGVDETAGRVMFASNLGWRDVALREPLAALLGVPVATGHDVRAAGLAEGLLGAGRRSRDFVFVVIGTGIAAAVICNGQPVGGALRMGGEFGHIPVHPGGERCACGQLGCLEVYASATGIARRHRAQGGPALSAAAIAESREPPACRVWDDAVEALALGLATLTLVLDPALFVLGGGLAEAGPRLLDPVAAALARHLAWRPAPPIRRSPLGAAAGLHGAAILGWQAAGFADAGQTWTAPVP